MSLWLKPGGSCSDFVVVCCTGPGSMFVPRHHWRADFISSLSTHHHHHHHHYLGPSRLTFKLSSSWASPHLVQFLSTFSFCSFFIPSFVFVVSQPFFLLTILVFLSSVLCLFSTSWFTLTNVNFLSSCASPLLVQFFLCTFSWPFRRFYHRFFFLLAMLLFLSCLFSRKHLLFLVSFLLYSSKVLIRPYSQP